jgi:hypothetical protein
MKDRKTMVLAASIVFTPVVALGLYMLWDAEKTRRLRDEKTAQTRRQIADLEANRIAEEKAERERRAKLAKEEKASKPKLDPRLAMYNAPRNESNLVEPQNSELADTSLCRALLTSNLKDPDSYREFSANFLSTPVSKRHAKEVFIRYSATNSYGGRIQGTFLCGWNIKTGEINTY